MDFSKYRGRKVKTNMIKGLSSNIKKASIKPMLYKDRDTNEDRSKFLKLYMLKILPVT